MKLKEQIEKLNNEQLETIKRLVDFDNRLDKIEKSIQDQIELVKKIDELDTRVRELENQKSQPVIPQPQSVPLIQPSVPSTEFPVPQEYYGLVTEILNPSFKIKVVYQEKGFIFNLFVPREYSQLKEDEWNVHGADLRVKVISFAEGANGVKAFLNQVWNTFQPEIKAKIKA